MRIWNEQKMADLVAEQARLSGLLSVASLRLNEMRESDTAWDGLRSEVYNRDQMFHAQVTRELSLTNSEIGVLENFRPSAVRETAESPFTRFLKQGENGLAQDERETMLGEIVDGSVPNGGGLTFIIRPEDQTTSDTASGQELVPETISPNVVDRLSHYGGISKMAQQFMTSTGNEFRVPQHDEATAEGEILAAQSTDVAVAALANFGVVTFGAKTASSKAIKITREMLQDSIIDVASFAARRAVRRMGRSWDKEFTTGATSGGAVGVTGAAAAGITTATTLVVTYDEFVNLVYKVNRAYREGGEDGEGGISSMMGGRIGFLMSDAMEMLIRKVKDTAGRPLWWPQAVSSGLTGPLPSTFMNYPYEVSGPMDGIVSTKVPMLFGNFSYYGIRTVSAVEIFRFQDSRTMQDNSIEILGFSRRDARAMGARIPTGSTGAGLCEAIVKLTIK